MSINVSQHLLSFAQVAVKIAVNCLRLAWASNQTPPAWLSSEHPVNNGYPTDIL
jgi:hypothetical protein